MLVVGWREKGEERKKEREASVSTGKGKRKREKKKEKRKEKETLVGLDWVVFNLDHSFRVSILFSISFLFF